MTRTKLLTLAIFVIALTIVPSVFADEVFGNLPDNGVYGGWCSPVALGFSVPEGQNFSLDSIRLGLTHLANGSITLQIFSDNEGVPGEAVATLGNQTVTQNNIYTFDASMTLAGGQTYWLYVDASACNVTWDDIGEVQPSGDFSVEGYLRYTSEWVDATDDGRLMPALLLNATEVSGN